MFARTERLLLRPAWVEDAPALQRAIADEAVVRNLARVPWPYALADAQAFVEAPRSGHEPALLIFRRGAEAPELVGGIGIARAAGTIPELGYWIARPRWGRGYASEAGAALLRVAVDTLRIPRLSAGHFLDNPASGRVLRKLGFRPTGRIDTRFCRARGEDVPFADFALDLRAPTSEGAGNGSDVLAA